MKRLFYALALLLIASPLMAAQQTILGGSGVLWGDEKTKINSNFSELYGKLPQALLTTSSPTFVDLTLTSDLNLKDWIYFTSDDDTHYVAVAAGNNTANYILRWPTAAPGGSNYILNFDADGTGGWTDPATFLTPTGSGSSLTITASGFDGNLATTDDTLQEVAQKVDDLVLGGGGYTNLTSFVAQTAWRIFYSNANGDVTELALGADGEYLKSNGASAAPSWATPSGAAHDAVSLSTDLGNNLLGLSTQQLTLDSQTANYMFAAPNGSAGVPSFRAIVDADIPDTITASNYSLTSHNHTGTYEPADADLTDLADGTLTGSKVGTGISGTNITTGTVPDAQIASTIARDSEVTSAVSTHAGLADPHTGYMLESNVGTGANNYVQLNASSQLPAVSAALLTNFPALNQNTTGTAGGLSGTPNITVGTISAGATGFSVDADGDTTAKTVTAGQYLSSAADGSRYSTLPNNTSGNAPAAATVVNGFYTYINELYGVENSGTASKLLMQNDIDTAITNGNTTKLISSDQAYDALALKLTIADIDDTPVNGETAAPISSNWAYDHAAATATHGVSGAIVGTTDSATLTNKTLNVEGTGNSITIVDKVWFAAGGCNNTTATSFYDLPTSNPAAAACITGTNTQKGVLDFDAATDESGQVSLALPSDWSGNIDLKYKWLSAATSGSVVWGVQTSCVADAETDDPSWNTASTVTDTAKGTTNQTNDASMTSITITGCAAGELMHLRFFRDADNGSDGMTGDARLVGAELTIRRAQ